MRKSVASSVAFVGFESAKNYQLWKCMDWFINVSKLWNEEERVEKKEREIAVEWKTTQDSNLCSLSSAQNLTYSSCVTC